MYIEYINLIVHSILNQVRKYVWSKQIRKHQMTKPWSYRSDIDYNPVADISRHSPWSYRSDIEYKPVADISRHSLNTNL